MVTYSPTLKTTLETLQNDVHAVMQQVARPEARAERSHVRYRFITEGVIWELEQFDERIDVLINRENALEEFSGSLQSNEKKEKILAAYH